MQTVATKAPDTSALPAAPPPGVSEDWIAVGVAAVLIAAILFGLRLDPIQFGWTTGGDLARVLGPASFLRWLQLGLFLVIPTVLGARLLGARPANFVIGFGVLYLFATLAQVLAGYTGSSSLGLEYVLYALIIGLVLRQVTPIGRRFREAVQAEYYIKIGLVVLGASVLFSELVQAGLLGIGQALAVVISVWTFCFWLAKRLHVDDELATMLSSAVSICGVSAAIATCGAIQGDRQKLSYVTSLVLVVAVPMMIVMPWISRAAGMPDVVAGAWLGGTLDTSAAVVAAGELISDQARNAAVVVKLSQNVLIGVAAFLLTVWWTMRKGGQATASSSAAVIWERFPKFVLGFLAVSLIFSFALSAQAVNDTRGMLNALRTAWFALAFLSIGLETSISELVKTGGGRPVAAFLGGQLFNIVITLVLAYLLFGGVLFPAPVFNSRIVSSSTTEMTPSVSLANWSARARSASESTVPFRRTTPSAVSTSMREASIVSSSAIFDLILAVSAALDASLCAAFAPTATLPAIAAPASRAVPTSTASPAVPTAYGDSRSLRLAMR